MKTKEDYLKEMLIEGVKNIEKFKRIILSENKNIDDVMLLLVSLFCSNNTTTNSIAEILCKIDDIDNRLKKIEDLLREGL